MKVIIAGGRHFNDYLMLRNKCDLFLHKCSSVEIVSGKARGADQLGEQYALERGYKLTEFPADWDRHGKGAGYRRNEEMAKYADALIAFWDGMSRGTEHMINLAKKHGLKIRIVTFN